MTTTKNHNRKKVMLKQNSMVNLYTNWNGLANCIQSTYNNNTQKKKYTWVCIFINMSVVFSHFFVYLSSVT